MIKFICRLLFKSIGWKAVLIPDTFPEKCVICVAPHTSNWDFIIAKLYYTSVGKTASFLIKDTWFFFPFNLIFNAIGGVPVDRKKTSDLTSILSAEFGKNKQFQLAITPEATRKANPDWKKGFYQIALNAKVPVVLIYLDYEKKEIGSLGIFIPTGDEESEIQKIKKMYSDVKACYPEQFVI